MENTCFLSLIIPAYNEEKRLPDCIEKLKGFISSQKEPVEVLLVENGSSDATYQMASAYREQLPWLTVLHEDKAGKGGAIRRGMLASHGKYRMFADIDFAMPVEEISKFIPPKLHNFDVAIASRAAKGSVQKNKSPIRSLSSNIFNLFVQLLAVRGIRDTQCGFKCFTAAAAEKIFSVQTIEGWAFDVEVLYIAKHFNMRIAEIPVTVFYDENSKVKLWTAVPKMMLDIFKIRKNSKNGLYDRISG